jgi:flagellar biosynthesis GTPase FlhF
MSSTDLLAKIDALDWDHTVSPATTIMANSKPTTNARAAPTSVRSLGLIAGGIVLLGIAAAIFFGMAGPDTQASKSAAGAPVVAAAPSAARSADPPVADAVHEDRMAAVAAAEEKRAAMYAQAVEESERKLQQKAERQRKAKEAAAQARLARDERERQQQEEATRQRAEREAAAAAKAQEVAAAPKGPSSPKELCAGESNVFARGFCESRACGKPEWRSHPFCVKRMEDQLRSFGSN